MSGWWCSGFIVVFISVLVNSKVDLDSPIRLAHCRAFCLHQIQATMATDIECQKSLNCSKCWTACDHLQKSRSSRVCDQLDCGVGCQTACRFPSQFPGPEPVQLAPHEDVLSLSDGMVSWPPPEPMSEPVVYAVLAQPQGLLAQTLGTNAALPPAVDSTTVRVLVVDRHGLARVLSPPQESPVAQALHIVRSLGMEKKMGLENADNQRMYKENVTKAINESELQYNPKPLWRLKEVSRLHQSALVLVQISWLPQQLSAATQPVYLVTWEVGGGVLRGNLLTNSTIVTLSLWPDTEYRIQVALFSSDSTGSYSESLVLDTHHPLEDPASVVHPLPNPPPVSEKALVVALSSGVTMFLFFTVVLTWRWQHRLSLPHSKLFDAEVGTPNLYRVFPPVVRLIADSYESPDIFSSTDNLLQSTSAVRK